MSASKCYVCQKKLGLDEENICTRCELKDDDDDNDQVTNDVNCGACKFIVEEDSEGLKCDVCNTWYHNYCCENPLLENLYGLLNEAPNNIKWFCDKCTWETEKWFENIRITMVSNRVSDNEQKYQESGRSKEPEIKIEIQNEGIPNNSDDNQSNYSDDDTERKAVKKVRTLLKKAYQCTQCEKSFSYKTSFMKHTALHNSAGSYTCTFCESVFEKIYDLEKHLKEHSEEKIFKCSYCGKRFCNQHRVNIHERIHTGEKPYVCSHCGRAFTQENQLVKHERIHTGEKPYKCNHCEKEFTRPDNLKNHERIHTGEKPYQCGHCGRVFARYDNFKTHERIHTGERPYPCDQCDKRFRAKTGLREHLKTHTGEKPFQCNLCGKFFRDRTSRRQHLKTHNGNEPFQSSSTVTRDATVTQPNSILPVSGTIRPDITRTSHSSINLPILSSITNNFTMSVAPQLSRPLLTPSSPNNITMSVTPQLSRPILSPSSPNNITMSVTPQLSRPNLSPSSSPIITPSHQMPLCLMPSQSLPYPSRQDEQYGHS